MAAFELTIKAMSRADLEEAVHDLAAFFPRGEEAEGTAAGAGQAPGAPAAKRSRGRPRKLLEDVSAAQDQGAAREVPADNVAAAGGQQEQGDLGRAAGGEAGALEPAPAGQDPVEAGEPAQTEAEAGPEEAPQESAAADAAGDSGEDAAGSPGLEDAADGQAAVGAGAVEAGDAAPQGGAEITVEDVKTAAKALIGSKGFHAAQAVFKAHGVAKPGETPPEKLAAVLADLKKGLGQ